jgi:hypothetical protein
MRALMLSCALLATLAAPLAAQAPRFLKVDVVGKSGLGHHHGACEGPTEVHLRVPVALAKSVLQMAEDGEIRVNGRHRRGLKVDQLIRLLESSRPGDLLLELTTDKGDQVKIVLE